MKRIHVSSKLVTQFSNIKEKCLDDPVVEVLNTLPLYEFTCIHTYIYMEYGMYIRNTSQVIVAG